MLLQWRRPGCPPRTRAGLGRAEDCADRAMVAHVLGAEAPDNVVVQLRPVDRRLALVGVAQALPAAAPAAAIVIRDDVVLVVGGVEARADPGHVGNRRARWALAYRAAAT